MIKAFHLLWIVPLTSFLTICVLALANIAHKEQEQRRAGHP